MSAFASMLMAVHADTNIGTPADFRHPPGPWVPARVVLSRPTDTIGGLGGLGTRAGSLLDAEVDAIGLRALALLRPDQAVEGNSEPNLPAPASPTPLPVG